eukprot:5445348-Pyramimonas_sp.AAC.1
MPPGARRASVLLSKKAEEEDSKYVKDSTTSVEPAWTPREADNAGTNKGTDNAGTNARFVDPSHGSRISLISSTRLGVVPGWACGGARSVAN